MESTTTVSLDGLKKKDSSKVEGDKVETRKGTGA